MRPEKQQRYRKSARVSTKERCGSAMYRIFEFADVIEAMLTMKAETMGISDGTWSAVLEGQAGDRRR